jgi:hypothetical protein
MIIETIISAVPLKYFSLAFRVIKGAFIVRDRRGALSDLRTACGDGVISRIDVERLSAASLRAVANSCLLLPDIVS